MKITPAEKQLILDAIDENLPVADFPRLQQLLRENPAALDFYSHEILLHGEIEWHYNIHRNLPGAHQRRAQVIQEVRKRQQHKIITLSLAAAALVILTLGITGFLLKSKQQTLTLTFNDTARHRILRAHPSTAPSENLKPGDTLILDQGAVQLNFPIGVQAILEAPASLIFLNEKLIRLDHGTAHFEISTPAARGFTVNLPHSSVIDLGTRFGILAPPGQPAEIHVFHGRVRSSRQSTTTYSKLPDLTANTAVREDDNAPTGYSNILPRRNAFHDQLPSGKNTFSLSFDDITEEDGALNSFAAYNTVLLNNGQIRLTDGISGNAIRFDGSGSHLSFPEASAFLKKSPGTISFWFRIPDAPTVNSLKIQIPLSWGNPEETNFARWSIALLPLNPSFTASIRPGMDTTLHTKANIPYSFGKWHHIAYVFDTGGSGQHRIKTYFNGEEIEATQSPTLPPNLSHSGGFIVGNHIDPALHQTHGFHGDIDEITFLRQALDSTGIRNLFLKHNKP